MRRNAAIDLVVLAVVFWGVWSLRFLGVPQIGLLTMLAVVCVGLALHASRRRAWRDIGITLSGGLTFNITRGLEASGVILLATMAGVLVAQALGFEVSQSNVVTDQPDPPLAFLIDLVVGGWIGAAIGEELFFRGLLLDRLRRLLPGGRVALAMAVVLQALWFASAHVTQGLGGMLAIALIGVAIGVYFLTRARASLVPVIIGHGVVNTIVLSAAYFTA